MKKKESVVPAEVSTTRHGQLLMSKADGTWWWCSGYAPVVLLDVVIWCAG